MDDDDAVAVGEPAAQVGDGALEVAAVALDRDGADALRGTLGELGVEAERADRPPRHPELAGVGAHVVELAVRRGAEVDRRGATARGGRPGRAEELLAGGDQVVGTAADPLGVDHDDLGVARASRRRGARARRPAPAPATPSPRRRCRPRSWRSSRPAAGGPRPARPRGGVRRRSGAARGRAAPTAVGQLARSCAGRRPRTSGPRRPRRPRTPPGPGAARSAGRRRRARRGRRTRRASPPGRPGCRPRRRAGVRRRRGRPCRPAASSTGSRSPRPLTCGCRIERTGATTTRSRPEPAPRLRVTQPAQHREPAADGVAARAEPLVGQGLPARVVGHRRRVDQGAQLLRSAPRPRGRWRSPAGPCARPGPARRPGTAAARRARSGRAVPGAGASARASASGGVAEDDLGQGGEDHGHLTDVGGDSTRAPNRRREGVRHPE